MPNSFNRGVQNWRKGKLLQILFGLSTVLSGCASVAGDHAVNRPRHVHHYTDKGLAVMVETPASYTQENSLAPLLIFLHGSGERGGTVDNVLIHGPWEYARRTADFPFVVAAPHLPENEVWSSEDIEDIVSSLQSTYRIDDKRIYLTGLSLGGHGVWETAIAYPGLFAAIAPISGRGNPEQSCRLRDTPVWAFHGVDDDVVAPSGSLDMVLSIQNCGDLIGLTLYPDTNHNAWTRTYNDRRLYDWMLSHRLEAEQ